MKRQKGSKVNCPRMAGQLSLIIMTGPKDHNAARKGFALLVVLSTLSILTLLFAISTRLSLAHMRAQDTDLILAERAAMNPVLLREAATELRRTPGTTTLAVELGDRAYDLAIVDAGGMIDLNAATPSLLDAYLGAIGLTSAERDRFRSWRRTTGRLLRVVDVPRISGASNLDLALLQETATVYSGRTGVAREVMPERLARLLPESLPPGWISAPSGTNFYVFRHLPEGLLPVGALHLRPSGVPKLLWVD